LSCQKKVPKEKSRPPRRPAAPGSLRCSCPTGRCGTRACGPQTVLALFPVAPCAARRRRGHEQNRVLFHPRAVVQRRFGIPLEDAEQRSLERGSGRALFEGEARVAQPPLRASSARNPANGGASTRGRLFFGYFLLAKQKKVSPRIRRGTQRFRKKLRISAQDKPQSPVDHSAPHPDPLPPTPTLHAEQSPCHPAP